MAMPSSDVRSLTLSNVANQLPDAPARPEDALNPGEMVGRSPFEMEEC
jgi:hypothetical protein